ncbi:Crp/Fnr family transcriptional regulator [Zhouia sp. PK063]|uniref:Crp/Fnr family transcriptional regulator n=1 Tax=Zhouia sp. PK063 TaxID=3373602 RepID=UPI0037BC63DB
MCLAFKKHIDKFTQLDNASFEVVMSFFEVTKVQKKEHLLRSGTVCQYQYFVVDGCLRKYFIKENGLEQTTEFALENWWISDTFAFERHESSSFNIQAVEAATVLRISYTQREALVLEHPCMEHYFRMVYQRAYAAAERRIAYLYEWSREELYLHFVSQYPEFVQRIPQYLLASFLGFTPEYLSEIRNKHRS